MQQQSFVLSPRTPPVPPPVQQQHLNLEGTDQNSPFSTTTVGINSNYAANIGTTNRRSQTSSSSATTTRPPTGVKFQTKDRLVLALTVIIFLAWFVTADNTSPTTAALHPPQESIETLLAKAQRLTTRYTPLRPHGDLVRTLIIVPCHATFRGANYREFEKESNWGLEPDQHGKRLIPAITAHMRRAVELALEQSDSETDRAALIFSGGQTRRDTAARSEAQSYLDVVVANREGTASSSATRREQRGFPDVSRLLKGRAGPGDRYLFTEEHARDSFENVLFSLCRFFEIFGHFPGRLVIVGFEFKRKRFEQLHLPSIRWPRAQFEYIGIDDDDVEVHTAPSEATKNGDSLAPPPLLSDAESYEVTRKDLYLCSANEASRTKRNINSRGIQYYTSVPESVLRLLTYCGPELYNDEDLPWWHKPPPPAV